MGKHGTSFTQMLDPEPVRLSPLMEFGYRTAPCGRCGQDVNGRARWLWRTTADKDLVHAKCVTDEEWTAKLRGGTGLTYPKAIRESESRNAVTFTWHIEDYEGASGTPTHDETARIEEVSAAIYPINEEEDHDYEASFDYQHAA